MFNKSKDHQNGLYLNTDARLNFARGGKTAKAIHNTKYAQVGAYECLRAWADLGADIAGYGPILGKLVQDEKVTDILVNAPNEIWVDRGSGLEKTSLSIGGEQELRSLAVRLASSAGKRLDDASPIADGTLPGGLRLHAILPPLSNPYPLISLRCPRSKGWDFNELITTGMISRELAPILKAMLEKKAATFISGATGSGKTTLLAALLAMIPTTERIVCIEEVSELHPKHPHVVHLQERHPNIQGSGAIPMSLLVRAAMRMRPDRIILGECRGAEVREVLSAMNTGHEGAWATVHANAVKDVPARLVALGALAGMSESTVAAQVNAGVDAFLHIRRELIDGKLLRWISEIGIPVWKKDKLLAELAISVNPNGQIYFHPAWEQLHSRLNMDLDHPLLSNFIF